MYKVMIKKDFVLQKKYTNETYVKSVINALLYFH